jgi:hypothetical protein
MSDTKPEIDLWGQLGHLDEEQLNTLQDFLKAAPPEQVELGKFSAESLDQFGLRFLRARQFNLEKSLELLKLCYEKKTEMKARECAQTIPDDLCKCDVAAMKNWYPHAMAGFDRFGRPILFEHTGGINQYVLIQMTNKTNLINYHFWVMEKSLNDHFTAASERAKATNETINFATLAILDFTDFGVAHCSSRMLDQAQSLIAIDNICYPETLGKLFVVNVPWVAVATWDIVKRWYEMKNVS